MPGDEQQEQRSVSALLNCECAVAMDLGTLLTQDAALSASSRADSEKELHSGSVSCKRPRSPSAEQAEEAQGTALSLAPGECRTSLLQQKDEGSAVVAGVEMVSEQPYACNAEGHPGVVGEGPSRRRRDICRFRDGDDGSCFPSSLSLSLRQPLPNFSPPPPWTAQEDMCLLDFLISVYRDPVGTDSCPLVDWQFVSETCFPGRDLSVWRSDVDCYRRWVHSIVPHVVAGHEPTDVESMLLACVVKRQLGEGPLSQSDAAVLLHFWSSISLGLFPRSPFQCRYIWRRIEFANSSLSSESLFAMLHSLVYDRTMTLEAMQYEMCSRCGYLLTLPLLGLPGNCCPDHGSSDSLSQ